MADIDAGASGESRVDDSGQHITRPSEPRTVGRERSNHDTCKIKICRVKDFAVARRLALVGVDYLGFHILNDEQLAHLGHPLISANRSLVDDELFDGGVLLTRSTEIDLILSAVERGKFSTIQVHTQAPLQFWIDLRAASRSIDMSIIGVIDPTITEPKQRRMIAQQVDFTLFDWIRGGTGRQLPTAVLEGIEMHRSFYAGGVKEANLVELVQRFRPYAVDIQSGSELGEQKGGKERKEVKDFGIIARLVQLTKGGNQVVRRKARTASIALAIDGQDRTISRLVSPHVDAIHLDLWHTSSDLHLLTQLSEEYPDQLIEVHAFHPHQTLLETDFESWPRCISMVLLQLDTSEVNQNSPETYVRIVEAASAAGYRVGVALNSNSLKDKFSDGISQILLIDQIEHVNIILPDLGSDQYFGVREHFTRVQRLVQSVREDLTFGIDRMVTLEAIHELGEIELASVTIGTALHNARNPSELVQAIRLALSR